MKHPEKLVTVAENMEKVKDGGLALAIRNSGVNLFDAGVLLQATGWTETDGIYSGIPQYLYNVFNPHTKDVSLFYGFKQNTQYTLSFKSYQQEDTINYTSAFFFRYTDGTDSELVTIWNTEEEKKTLTSDSGKTIAGLYATFGRNSTVYIRDIRLEITRVAVTDTLTNRGHRLMPEMNEILSGMNDIYQAGQASAAALKTSVSGAAISVNDVNTVEHNVGVKLRSKNLALAEDIYKDAFAYAITTFEGRKCVRFLDNVAFNWNGIPFKENTQYTVSFDVRIAHREETATQLSALFYFFYSDGTFSRLTSYRNTEWEHFTLTSTAGKTVTSIGLKSYSFYNWLYIDCGSFQLEEGSVETDYTPYIEDFTNADLGKNLFDINLDPHSIHWAVSLVSLNDGELTIKQNATAQYASYNIAIPNANNLVGKTITISCDCKVGEGGNNTTVRILWLNSNGKASAGTDILYKPYVSSTEYQHISVSGVVNAQPDESYDTLALMFYGNVTGTLSDGEYYAYFKNIQIELGTTATDYEPYREPIAAEVSRYGKNLLDFSIAYLYDTGSNTSYYDNGKLYVETGGGNSLGLYTNKIYLPTNTPLCYQHKVSNTAADRVIIRCFDENDNNISADISIGWGSYLAYYEGYFGTGNNGANFTLPAEVSYIVLAYCRMNNTDVVQNEYSNIQIELGTTPTSYKPYVEPLKSKVNSIGIVEGIKSLSPNMTLMTDTPGVVINAEYFRQQ